MKPAALKTINWVAFYSLLNIYLVFLYEAFMDYFVGLTVYLWWGPPENTWSFILQEYLFSVLQVTVIATAVGAGLATAFVEVGHGRHGVTIYRVAVFIGSSIAIRLWVAFVEMALWT